MTEPVHIPIDGNLDLHTFDPKDLPDLLDDYLAACAEQGILSVRVIHGKGTGQLKLRVRSLLARHPLVVSFSDAPSNAGGWGATVATLAVQRKG
jgi:DNA-nicking Smr family endonuclease